MLDTAGEGAPVPWSLPLGRTLAPRGLVRNVGPHHQPSPQFLTHSESPGRRTRERQVFSGHSPLFSLLSGQVARGPAQTRVLIMLLAGSRPGCSGTSLCISSPLGGAGPWVLAETEAVRAQPTPSGRVWWGKRQPWRSLPGP